MSSNVNMRLLESLPAGETFNMLMSKISLIDILFSSYDINGVIEKMTFEDLVKKSKGLSVTSMEAVVRATDCQEFLQHVWSTDRRKKIRGEVAANRHASDELVLEAVLVAGKEPLVAECLRFGQTPQRMMALARMDSRVYDFVVKSLPSHNSFGNSYRHWLFSLNAREWPEFLDTGPDGASVLYWIALRDMARLLPEDIDFVLSTWTEFTSPAFEAKWRELFSTVLLRQAKAETFKATLVKYPWPELAAGMVQSFGQLMTGETLQPLEACPEFIPLRTYGNMIHWGAQVDAVLMRFMLSGDWEQAFGFRGIPLKSDDCPQRISDSGLDVLLSEAPWKSTGRSPLGWESSPHGRRIVEWAFSVATLTQLVKLLNCGMDPQLVKDRLKASNALKETFQGLPPEVLADALTAIEDPDVRCSVIPEVLKPWTTAQWQEYGMGFLDEMFSLHPSDSFLRLASLPVSARNIRVLLQMIKDSVYPEVALNLASLPWWESKEASDNLQLRRLVLRALETYVQPNQAGVLGFPRPGAAWVHPLIWQDVTEYVTLDWVKENIPQTYAYKVKYLQDAFLGGYRKDLQGEFINVLLPEIQVRWATAQTSGLWEATIAYLVTELGEDQSYWEAVFTLLPDWEGSLRELVTAVTTL